MGRSGRRPPGPGDLPISNLPPPPSVTWADDPDLDEVLEDGVDDDLDDGRPPEADAGGTGEPLVEGDEVRAPDLDVPVVVDDGLGIEDPHDELVPDDPTEGLVDDDLDDPVGERDPEPALVDVGVDMDLDRVAAPDDGAAAASAAADDPIPGASAAHGHPRRRAVLVLLVVAALVYGVLKIQQANDLAGDRDDREAVQEVARAFGAAYLTYDYQHVERSARALHHLSTAAFAEAYAAQSAPGIEQLFSSRQTSTRAQTQEVFVGAVRQASARALVVVDVTATSPTDGEQRLDDVSFVLDLARTGDGWRVAKVARSPQATLEAPPAPTTTAVPAAP